MSYRDQQGAALAPANLETALLTSASKLHQQDQSTKREGKTRRQIQTAIKAGAKCKDFTTDNTILTESTNTIFAGLARREQALPAWQQGTPYVGAWSSRGVSVPLRCLAAEPQACHPRLCPF